MRASDKCQWSVSRLAVVARRYGCRAGSSLDLLPRPFMAGGGLRPVRPYGVGEVTTVVEPPVTKVLGTAPVPRMMFRKP